MNSTKILARTFFILSHLGLFFMFLFEKELQENDFPFLAVLWGLGVLSLGFNIYWADQLNISKWVLILLTMSGLVWAFPPALATYFGIPFLIIFLVLGIFIHSRASRKIRD